MYFFASRLSSAVCYRWEEKDSPRSSLECVHRRQPQEPLRPPVPSSSSPVPSTSTSTSTAVCIVEPAPYSTIRAGVGSCCRRPQPVPPPRVPTLQTVSQVVSDATSTSASVVTAAVPSAPDASRHRVRFANTFPRAARKKVGKCYFFTDAFRCCHLF